MTIRTSIAALALTLMAATSFAGATTPASATSPTMAAAAAAPVAAKKMHCPKGEHRVAGKCVKK